MSIDMYVSKSKAQATSTSQVCQQHLEGYEALQQAISQFTLEPFLIGKAYDSAKAYYSAVLYPLVQGGILLTEATEEAVKKFPERYQSEVDSGDLKESELEEQIRKANDLINQANALQTEITQSLLPETDQRTQLNLNQDLIQAYQTNKEELEDKLRKLRDFHASSPSIFSEIASLKQAIDQGIAQTKTAWNGTSGTFGTTGLNLDWVKTINQKWQIRQGKQVMSINQINKDDIIQDYVETYGIKNSEAEVIYELQEGILKTANEKNWDNEQVIYEFNRIIASCASDNYVARRWKAICGTMEEDDLYNLCKQYGLSNSEINTLKNAVDTQHKNTTSKKDLAHEAVQIAAFTEKSWTRFLSISNALHNISHLANEGYEHEEISFKGDVDSGRYDDVDFSSDLDAINTYNKMKEANRDNIFRVQTQYNDAINKNAINRVDEFYKNYGDGNRQVGEKVINQIMDADTIGSNHINGGYTEAERKKHKEDFYEYLKRGENSNVK